MFNDLWALMLIIWLYSTTNKMFEYLDWFFFKVKPADKKEQRKRR